jgi:hypothetical protein
MYHFVVHNPKGRSKPKSSSSADQRRAELQDSDARAHAAKIAFLKKKAKEERAQRSTSASVITQEKSTSTLPAKSGEESEAWTDIVDDNRSSKPASSSSDSDSGTEAPGAVHKPLQVGNKRNAVVFVEEGRKPLQTIFHIEPYSLLSQSRKDPFNAYPHRRLPDYVQNIVNHGQFSSVL